MTWIDGPTRFLGALPIVFLGAACLAAPVPETARSLALSIPSELLASDVLLFRFPQRAGRTLSGLSAFGATSTRANVMAARATISDLHLYYESSRDFDSPVALTSSQPLLQVGSSTSFGALDVGAAFAWSTFGSKRTNERNGTASGVMVRRIDSNFDTIDYRQFLLGAGWSRGTSTVDVSMTLTRHKYRHEWSYRVRSLEVNATRQREQSFLDVDTGYRPGALVRAEFAIGRLGVSVHGLYAVTSLNEESMLTREGPSVGGLELFDVVRSTASRSGTTWSVGIAADHEVVHSLKARSFARFSRDRGAPQYDADTYQWRSIQDRVDEVRLGLSLEMPVARRWLVMTGVAAAVASGEEIRHDYRGSGELTVSHWNEDAQTEFGWGVRYELPSCEITTHVRSPGLSSMFYSVDIAFFFGE